MPVPMAATRVWGCRDGEADAAGASRARIATSRPVMMATKPRRFAAPCRLLAYGSLTPPVSRRNACGTGLFGEMKG